VREKQANRRIRLLLALFVLVFAGTFARAVWLQGVRASTLGHLAEQQHRETIEVPAGRGTIFDRTGVQLALGEQTTTVYADPMQVTAPRKLAVAAHDLLGADANALYPQLLLRRSHFLYVRRFADPKRAARFVARGFAGVYSYPEERRSYPQHTVAAQVVGYAGVDNRGLAGLEIAYDRRLAGHAGKETIVRDPFGRAIDVVSSTSEQQGSDIFTTLDHTIQAQAEAVLRKTVAHWRARSATAVVLDPRTGAVLALAQAPGYDANRADRTPLALQRNRAITDTYEPGSTFKLVTVTAALSERLVRPQSRFRLPYSIHVADRVVHDAEERGTEWMSVAEILSRSSNVGAVTLAQKLGAPALAEWIDRFGFGKKTRIDFPGESGGLVLPLDRWSGSTIGNVPIGQGIAVTPIQMAAAYGAVANGGTLVQPHRRGGRHRHARGDPGLHGRGQDRHCAEARRARRLLQLPVRRVVRRDGAGVEPAAGRARRRRRPARRDLRRHRGGSRLRRDRQVRPAVPRGRAGRPADDRGVADETGAARCSGAATPSRTSSRLGAR
jgi:cell division protein FtsI/penicillin-binding protein 2